MEPPSADLFVAVDAVVGAAYFFILRKFRALRFFRAVARSGDVATAWMPAKFVSMSSSVIPCFPIIVWRYETK